MNEEKASRSSNILERIDILELTNKELRDEVERYRQRVASIEMTIGISVTGSPLLKSPS